MQLTGITADVAARDDLEPAPARTNAHTRLGQSPTVMTNSLHIRDDLDDTKTLLRQ